MKKSGDEQDVLSLITARPPQEGTFTLGSVTFDDNGAYQRPQTIQRHGLVRRAEPPVFNTGHDPHLITFPKYEDGRVVELPGMPEPHSRTLPVVEDKE